MELSASIAPIVAPGSVVITGSYLSYTPEPLREIQYAYGSQGWAPIDAFLANKDGWSGFISVPPIAGELVIFLRISLPEFPGLTSVRTTVVLPDAPPTG